MRIYCDKEIKSGLLKKVQIYHLCIEILKKSNYKTIIMKKIIAFSVFSLAIGGTFSQKDTTVYEEIIIQRNRLEIPFSQATRNVDILTAEEIKKLLFEQLTNYLPMLEELISVSADLLETKQTLALMGVLLNKLSFSLME